MMCLGRYVGLPARCFTINNHVVPEFFYDNAWHMFDADLIEYFPKADGSIASLQEIVDEVGKWKAAAPRVRRDQQEQPLCVHGQTRLEDRPGDPSATRTTTTTAGCPRRVRLGRHDIAVRPDQQQLAVLLFDGLPRERRAPRGGEAHAQLVQQGPARQHGRRRGRRARSRPRSASSRSATRPNGATSPPAASATARLEYDVPLAAGVLGGGALRADNLAAFPKSGGPALHVKDALSPGVLDLRMPSSYVYLGGQLTFTPALGDGGQIKVLVSDNNGLDWKEVAAVEPSRPTEHRPQAAGLSPLRLPRPLRDEGQGDRARRAQVHARHPTLATAAAGPGPGGKQDRLQRGPGGRHDHHRRRHGTEFQGQATAVRRFPSQAGRLCPRCLPPR